MFSEQKIYRAVFLEVYRGICQKDRLEKEYLFKLI